MAQFDNIRRGVQDRVNALYGDLCAWTPHAGGPEQSARVLLNIPSELMALGEEDRDAWLFHPLGAWVEYAYPDFPGLYESVRNGTRETITVKGIVYRVTDVKQTWDGACFKAKIEPAA